MAYQTWTAKKLGVQAVSIAGEIVYTVPAVTKAMLKTLTICNTTASTKLVDIHLVPSGGGATTGNALMYQAEIPAKTTVNWDGLQILETGDSIRTKADAIGVTIHFSGSEAV